MMRPLLVVAGLLLVFGALILIRYGWSDGDDSPMPEWTGGVSGKLIAGATPAQGISARLGAPNRDRLAICVDVVGEGDYLRFIATERVRDALDTVNEGGPYWFSEPQPVVDAGCPAEPALYVSRDEGRTPFLLTAEEGRLVDQPSYYDLFVFLIPPADIREAEGDGQSRFSVEEVLSEGDTFGPVTDGLYVSYDEVCDHDLIVALLDFHLGPRTDYPFGPTPYFDAPPTFGITPSPPSPAPTPCY
jgi:hypothetical protein